MMLCVSLRRSSCIPSSNPSPNCLLTLAVLLPAAISVVPRSPTETYLRSQPQ